MIEQAARTRRVVRAEDLAARATRPAEPAQQIGAALEADQRIVVAAPGSRVRASAPGVPPARRHRPAADRAASRREHAAREHARLASARPSERPIALPRRGVAVAPGRARAGIEQHADDGEVELGARPRRAIGPCRTRRRSRAQRSTPSIDEMPPARVEGDVERSDSSCAMVASTASATPSRRSRSTRKCGSPSSQAEREHLLGARSRTACAVSSESASRSVAAACRHGLNTSPARGRRCRSGPSAACGSGV